ncbi:hypothetical protein I2A86_001052 [Staphylococcus aureus]|nr:hypothetical protein [Staphylococcus aureus]
MKKSNSVFKKVAISGATFTLTAFLASINGASNVQAVENGSKEIKTTESKAQMPPKLNAANDTPTPTGPRPVAKKPTTL